MREIVDAESVLFERKRAHEPRHLNDQGEWEVASLPMLATNLATNRVEERRKSSFDAFRDIERWVLEHGFLELVRLRNRFARALGYANYFDLKLQKNERMETAALLRLLDDFVRQTDAANARALADLRTRHGEAATAPWNLRFHASGDVIRRLDPYLPFGLALRRWIDSFRRLGIQFRGATMQLDLLDRPGKHQNGFCHGPVPSWITETGRRVPAAINFTAEAKPDQVGSGLRAINTLFHEGGHAAHFANVVQNSPCFSQEYPPTSMAYAETQSMFCDQLLSDPDWMMRYAASADGQPIPASLILDRIASSQPMRAFDARSIAVVPYFESALYQMADDDLTPERVLALARETEVRVLGVESPRPLLAIPHLLNQESAASYQGYLLAYMAVAQTRAHLLGEAGYLTDNPAIGPTLAAHYWEPGNSVDHNQHAPQPDRRRLLCPASGRGLQRQRGRGLLACRVVDARRGRAPLSRCRAGVTRCAHPDRARRRAAGRHERRRSGDVRSIRRLGARELQGAWGIAVAAWSDGRGQPGVRPRSDPNSGAVRPGSPRRGQTWV